MINLIFIPRTIIEINQFKKNLEETDLKGEWNLKIKGFVFETTEYNIDELEDEIKETIAQGIEGDFKIDFK